MHALSHVPEPCNGVAEVSGSGCSRDFWSGQSEQTGSMVRGNGSSIRTLAGGSLSSVQIQEVRG